MHHYNTRLKNLFSVLNYERTINTSFIGSSVFGKDDIYKAWKKFVTKVLESGGEIPHFYYVKVCLYNHIAKLIFKVNLDKYFYRCDPSPSLFLFQNKFLCTCNTDFGCFFSGWGCPCSSPCLTCIFSCPSFCHVAALVSAPALDFCSYIYLGIKMGQKYKLKYTFRAIFPKENQEKLAMCIWINSAYF